MVNEQQTDGDVLNVSLHDAALLEEVELTTTLIIAASDTEKDRLDEDAVDRLLGL